MNNVNVAVIGAGRMGWLHAGNFHGKVSKGKVAAVVDQNKESADKLGSHLGAEVFSQVDDILMRPDIHAICISTPIGTHKELSLKALKAKKHVFCEKPLTLTVADAEEIAAAVKESGCCYQLGFMSRFDDAFEAAKEALEQGVVGTPVFIRSTSRDPGLPPVPGWGANPEACGDISFELCSHDYDRMCWLMDDKVRKVYAQAGILSSKDVAARCGGKMINDTLVINMEFCKGALGSVDGLLNIKYGYDARVEVVGDEGVIVIGDMGHVDVISANKSKKLSVPASPSFIDRFKHAYVKEAQHFIDCIIEHRNPKVGAEDGLQAVKIAAAVNKSIQLGQSVLID
ncbi:Gfo/Idh/MocA family oxidoreductase [Petroclostridium sp. X23]|uniref:Gfo/Idh/MocA family oxidoreductase n=1 Tax=Petroclostridium sp. X23 TaxID=3045146 RepID=UPI0024ADBC84|nr:Gfo/Idh/MocA family oxidoreductase [Petroclostridium sp. X23]WHH58508.1 Gfo/Idh/MocA family oxidoreductase [Petroclostridium sp. X23]